MTTSRIALVCAVLLLAAAAPDRAQTGTPVTLQAQSGSPLDAAARQLVADDLAAAKARGDRPLLAVGTANLGGERPDLFVQLQSPQECGSAGCTTSVFAYEHGGWRRVLDGAIGRMIVSARRTHGRADLIADKERFVWTGKEYRSTSSAPAIDLRPHHHRPAPRHNPGRGRQASIGTS